ncbi:unnamed protein product [Cercopithifilaria johnstoni]|uniref:DRBM domain-containing protein n=1 Tax=Cercopithifilaria johnstoni TaxID=2874296 RepID=A0A8J2MQB8_9BILA|nr:unnamed protein product [Cercopithifilaria johnstoni]
MVEKFYEVFTHVDVLRSREPEYFICEKPIVVDFDSFTSNRNSKNSKEIEKVEKLEVIDTDHKQMVEMQSSGGSSTSSIGTSVSPVKTFVSILEEGCKKYYDGTAPIFMPSLVEIPNSFAIRCELYGIHTVGYGRTKKIAKQMAAKDMLKKMIEKESFSDFGLGKTKEEALANLESMTIDFQNRGSNDESVVENWVGKVNARCQKLKLSNPTYEIDEEGPPNQRYFIAICKIGKVYVNAHGKTKKIAKALAAQKMCARLENWKELADDFGSATLAAASGQEAASSNEFTTGGSMNTLNAPAQTVLNPGLLHKVRSAFRDGFGTKGLTEKLTELVKSGDENISKVFPNPELKFIFLERDLDGNFQCMLSIDSPTDMKNAFYGFGPTEQDAKDYASRNALIHLDLFAGNSEPPLNSSDLSQTQGMDSSLTSAKNSPEEERHSS